MSTHIQTLTVNRKNGIEFVHLKNEWTNEKLNAFGVVSLFYGYIYLLGFSVRKETEKEAINLWDYKYNCIYWVRIQYDIHVCECVI